MDTQSVLQVIQAVSLTAAACAAVYGVGAWRNEFVGKKRIELAEEVLIGFYEARDTIRVIRNPFGYVGEGGTRQAGAGETPEEKQVLDNAYVVYERYEKHREVFNRVQALRYRFMAQFGKEAVQPFGDLAKILNDIFIAARMLSHYWRDQGHRTWSTNEEFQQHLAQMNRQEAVFWEMSADDEINQRVEDAVEKIEGICGGVIRQAPKPGFLSLMPWRSSTRTSRKSG